MCPDVIWQTYLGSIQIKLVGNIVMRKWPKLLTSIRISRRHTDGKSTAIDRNVDIDRIALLGIKSDWHVDCKCRKRILNDGSLAGVAYDNSSTGRIARVRN